MNGRDVTRVDVTISAGAGKEPSSVRLVATLALAGMLSGLALAGVYQVTKPTIDANKARALERAVFEVVPGATRMEKLVRDGGGLAAAGDAPRGVGEMVFAAFDDRDRFLGYAIEGAGAGYQDTIRLLFGYDPAARRVIGMYVLDSRETPGLGDRIFKDAAFVGNFADLAVDPGIVLVKGGRAADNEVDAITGATISSRAVVRIVDAALAAWRDALPAAGPAARPAARPDAGEGG